MLLTIFLQNLFKSFKDDDLLRRDLKAAVSILY